MDFDWGTTLKSLEKFVRRTILVNKYTQNMFFRVVERFEKNIKSQFFFFFGLLEIFFFGEFLILVSQ